MTTEKPIKLFVSTRGVLINEGRLLFLREANTYIEGTNPGKYDVPGGRLQPGENVLDALAREVEEETGQTPKEPRPFHVMEWRVVRPTEIWQIVAILYASITTSDQVKLSVDHDHFTWVTPEEALRLPLMKDYDIVLQKLKTLCGDLL